MLPSLAPIESEIVISTKSSKPCFTSIENIVPDENSCLTDETSYGRPAALASRKAANIGLANTSPTIVMSVTHSRSTARQSASGSKRRPGKDTRSEEHPSQIQ